MKQRNASKRYPPAAALHSILVDQRCNARVEGLQPVISRKPCGAPGKFLLAEVRNRRRRGKFRDMREVSRYSWIDCFELRPRLCVSDQNDGRGERNRIGLDGNARSALWCNFLAQHRCAQRQPGLRIGGELPGLDNDEIRNRRA